MHDLRRRFRRRFAIISTAVTVAAAIGVSSLMVYTYWNMLMQLGERRHGEIATSYFAAASEHSRAFLREARRLSPEALRRHPETLKLAELSKSFARGTRLVRVAIHDRDGYTLFSTLPDEIGTSASGSRLIQPSHRLPSRGACGGGPPRSTKGATR